MRSQLRLRVLLPVAVLGLLGIGFGAFAMGGPPDGAASSLTTTTATTTTTKERKPGPPSDKVWARRANKLCAKANAEVRRLGLPAVGDLAETIAFFEDVIEIAQRHRAEFDALGWPTGEKARVRRARALADAQIKLATKMLEALKAGDERRYLRLSKRADKISAPAMKLNRKLGADRCNEDPFAPTDPERGLAGALEENKVVVVLFYAPRSDYDAIQAYEARLGAAAAGAGFLAVNVLRDRQVASLAAAYQVRDAPAILVVKRGFRVAVRITGYADRETVAQAAFNARR